MSQDPHSDFADFFENGSLALHFVGADGTILKANKAELELLGYSADEYIGRNIAAVHADASTITEILRRLAAGERIRNYPARLRCKDGSVRHVLIDSSVRFEEAEFVHTRCFTRDVTSEVEARTRMEAAQRRLEFLASASGTFTASLDYKGTLDSVARLFVPAIADWCAVHAIGEDGDIRLVAMAHTDLDKEAIVREWLGREPISPRGKYGVPAVIRSGEPLYRPRVSLEMLERASRRPADVEALRGLGIRSAIIVPLAARGRTFGTITVFTSHSGRAYETADVPLMQELAKRAALALDNAASFAREQAARTAAEVANRVKDEFLAVLSHELRTPLTSAHGWLRIIRSRDLEPDKLRNALDVIGRSVDMQFRLINDLLEVSALTAGKVALEQQYVDLADIASGEVESFKATAAASGIDGVATIEKPVPVYADPARLRQVISNLVANALKFTPAGGRVVLAVSRLGSEGRIVVTDTGRGIEPDFLPHLFEKFTQAETSTTRRVGGLGLGLAIVKSFVELHGGTVRAESEGAGKGARFTVTLPIAGPPSP